VEIPVLVAFVFILGLRHGLDADHLACIDGLTRYNFKNNSKVTRWVGTLFSLGHGMIVTFIAVIIGNISNRFVIPNTVDAFVTWFSICSLLLIGTLNSYNLLRKTSDSQDVKLQGIKGRFIPRAIRETSNPFLIMGIGAIFALAADTVSQTGIWALAAEHNYMPFLLGVIFTLGMVLTDTIDSLLAYKIIKNSGAVATSASRLMGWVVVALAYGVALYEITTFFYEGADYLPELIGIVAFIFLVVFFTVVVVREKWQKA
jgi:nickel/cobalt transporter (NiCoT) family protein